MTTNTNDVQQTIYSELGYKSDAFPIYGPLLLLKPMSALVGISAPNPKNARVLELGVNLWWQYYFSSII